MNEMRNKKSKKYTTYLEKYFLFPLVKFSLPLFFLSGQLMEQKSKNAYFRSFLKIPPNLCNFEKFEKTFLNF